jgi:hypothetical protein
MEVKITQMFILDHIIYGYKRVHLYKKINTLFTPSKEMRIKIKPFFLGVDIESVTWNIESDIENSIEIRLKNREYGSKVGNKEKKEVKNKIQTKHQVDFEEGIKTFKDCGWIEEGNKL